MKRILHLVSVKTFAFKSSYKDTTSSSKVRYQKTKPNRICFPHFSNQIFLHMSRKYVSVFKEEYVLDHLEAFRYGCIVFISFPFLLQILEFYWPYGLVFWERKLDSFQSELLVPLLLNTSTQCTLIHICWLLVLKQPLSRPSTTTTSNLGHRVDHHALNQSPMRLVRYQRVLIKTV